MDIKSILSKKEEKIPEYLWSVIIEPDWVQAGVWAIVDGETEVISVSAPFAWKADDELVSTADAALSAAVQDLPEDASDPSKTVFGVSSTWVAEGQIQPQYLEKLKKLCAELSLTPSGFVVLPEAIAHFVKSKEGSPLSAILVGVSEENLEISLFRKGKHEGFSLVARSVSVADDVQEGLARFVSDEDALPSRILVYDGKETDLEDIKQSLVAVEWRELESVSFLHNPKVEVFKTDEKILATSLAGASEMAEVSTVKMISDDREETVEEIDENVAAPEGEVTAEDVGFVIGEDVADDRGGDLPGKDVQDEKPLAREKESAAPLQEKPMGKKRVGPVAFLDKINTAVSGALTKIANMRFPKIQSRNRLTTIIAVLVVLLAAGFFAWWFLPRATVTVYVSPRTLSDSLTIFVDPETGSTNVEERVLPGDTISKTVSGDKTASTTGTRTVGERATGTVTIYRVGPRVTLPAGTDITSPGGLGFTLNESTTVASGSATSPGTTDANVTAEDIGAEYNLDSGLTFSVGNYGGELEAQNGSSFSGGSSREISAVSEEDQENLLADLTEELLLGATGDLRSQASGGQYFIEGSVTSEVEREDYSASPGDEGDTLRLSLELSVVGIVVDREALFEIVSRELQQDVPEGYVLRESQVEMDFELEDEDDGVYELAVDIKANLLPELNPDEIAEEISGKYQNAALATLNKVPGFTRAQISFKPGRLPGFLKTLPHVAKRIVVEVAAER